MSLITVYWISGSAFRNHCECRGAISPDLKLTRCTCSITGHDTSYMDAQSVLTSIEQLLTLNGWVAAKCPTLTRPFGQNKNEEAYDELARQGHLYHIAMVIHSALVMRLAPAVLQ